MLRLTGIMIDVFLLVVLTLDYLRTKEYLEELNRLKHEVRKLNYEVCEIEDRLRGYKHG